MSKEANKIVPQLRFPEFENSKEWQKKPFSKLFKIGSGRDYKHLEKGEIPVYGTGGYMLSVNDYLYEGKSACIGRKGTINKPIFLTGKFWTVDTLFYTHSFKDCSPEFIYLLFQNINWLNYNEAGGVPSLSKVIIYKIEVYVPKPEEQEKIIKAFTSLDNLIIAETERLELLQDHKKSLLQQLFPAEGETQPKFRFPEFKDDEDWEEKRLDEIAKVVTGSTPKTSDSENYGGNKLFVSPADISEGRYINKTGKTLSKKGFSKSRIIPANSILFVCIGSTIGKLAQNKIECTTNQQINSLIPFKDNSNDFIYSLLENNSKYIASLSAQQAVPLINKSEFSAVKLHFPTNPKEQQKIADCLSSVDKLIDVQAKRIEQLQKHKKGLLQQLFPNVNELAI